MIERLEFDYFIGYDMSVFCKNLKITNAEAFHF